MGGIHPKNPPPLVPNCFIGTNAASGPTTMVCWLCLTVVSRAHRSGLERRNLMCGLEGHRASLLEEHQGQQKRDRQKGIDDHPPHIDEEVAEPRITTQRSNDCGQATEPDRRRKKEIRDTKENLAEIRKVLIARVMLEIRVGL